MVVGVDARHLNAGRGVGRYVRGMLGALDAPVRALVPGRRAAISMPCGIEVRRTAAPSRLVFGAAAVTGRPRLAQLLDEPDITWLPAPAPVAIGGPYVLTIHDLSWIERPRDFTMYERVWHRFARVKALARGARVVICDAPSVAEAVAQRWDIATRVVEPGVDDAPPDVVAHPGRYVLYVGALEPRKGLDVLARAWSLAPLDATELLIAGQGRLTVPGARHLGQISDAKLHALYAGALAVVLPSYLEGYGLTPREAAVHGTPSIVSDLPTLRRPGALTFAPGDADALADALRRLPAQREQLVAQLPAPRTWAQAADELLDVLRQAVAS